MVFAQDVCDKECTAEKDISKCHFHSECLYKQQHLDVGYNGGEYAESQQSSLSAQSVEEGDATVNHYK
jgi:hypothetical protein